MRVHLQTLGCRLNEAEVQGWIRDLTGAGHEIVEQADAADLVIFNTCAVTGEAARKSRQQIRRARRSSPGARLIVTGCYGTLAPDEAAALLGVDRVIANRDKENLTALLGLPPCKQPLTAPGTIPVTAPHGHTRAFVKIQDGCRYHCAYCIVTVARGEERSRSLADLIAEVNGLVAGGVAEVVLTGVHVGGYGCDLGSSLTELVSRLLSDTALPRLRLASVEPWALPDAFFALYANPRLMPHLHLPLQSGSDTVLRRMARRCRQADFRALVARAHDAVPDLNLTTDLIAGFPGESAADWDVTLALVEELGFGDLHLFPFSPREGTRAAVLSDQLPREVCKARCQQGIALARRLKRSRLAERVGSVAAVLLEGGGDDGRLRGYSPDYLRVSVAGPLPASLRGSVRPVRLIAIDTAGDGLVGRIDSAPA